MEQVKLNEARERLDELVERAAAGETIVIERDGGPRARLVAETKEKSNQPQFDAEKRRKWLEEVERRLQGQVMDPRSAEEIDAELRSLDRY